VGAAVLLDIAVTDWTQAAKLPGGVTPPFWRQVALWMRATACGVNPVRAPRAM
jgi:hypothetical protein